MNYVSQVAGIERVQSNLRYLSELRGEIKLDAAPEPIDDEECVNMKEHYEIGSRGTMLDLNDWLNKNVMDPAVEVS